MFIDFDPSDEENSLGKYLKSIREEKETSVDELAERTKIKKDYLIAIEADKYDELPQGPYLSLFLKSYSEALDIDYDDICMHLEQAQAAAGKIVKSGKSDSDRREDKRAAAAGARDLKPVVDMKTRPAIPPGEKPPGGGDTRNYLMIIGAFVFIAFIAVILIVILSAKNKSAADEAGLHGEASTKVQEEIPDQQAIDGNFYDQYDSLTVSIYPETQQAISVIADGIISTKLVNPAEIWTITAADSISISCERIDSTRYYINGFRIIGVENKLSENHPLSFQKNNWLEIVDTTEKEYGN